MEKKSSEDDDNTRNSLNLSKAQHKVQQTKRQHKWNIIKTVKNKKKQKQKTEIETETFPKS